jgi:hypothetical protein
MLESIIRVVLGGIFAAILSVLASRRLRSWSWIE